MSVHFNYPKRWQKCRTKTDECMDLPTFPAGKDYLLCTIQAVRLVDKRHRSTPLTRLTASLKTRECFAGTAKAK